MGFPNLCFHQVTGTPPRTVLMAALCAASVDRRATPWAFAGKHAGFHGGNQ
jgi:hypothetical protein